MGLDPLSFLAGFGTASGLSAAAWLSRSHLSRLHQNTEGRIKTTRELLGRAADERYTRELRDYLKRRHLAGHLIALTDILIEPRLIPGPPPAVPTLDNMETADIFEIVPLIHDLPFSYAPFNIETMTLHDLGAGDRHIAILGNSGIGKSTTLTTLALMALCEISFESLEDLTAQTIQEEEENLTDAEREERARERQLMQERAMEKLQEAEERRRELFVVTDPELMLGKREKTDLCSLIPILVDIRDLEFDPRAYGREKGTLDPAEPIVRAVQRQVSAVTAQIVGSALYPVLEAGRALILLDGYDDLNRSAQEAIYPWLKQLLEHYGQNMIVIAGPAAGYEMLTMLGFTPTFQRAWQEDEYTKLVERWSQAWAAATGAQPPDDLVKRLSIDNRARSMVDVTLKIWSGLADDVRETGRIGWYDALINRRLSAPETYDTLLSVATQLVDAQEPLQDTRIAETLTAAQPTGGDKATAEKAATGSVELLNAFVKDGVLVARPGSRYDLPHWQIGSYLAARALQKAGPQEAAEVALEPAWQDALSFAAGIMDLMPAVQRRMEMTPDLLYSTLFGLVRWVPDAPPDAPWRGELFRRLGAALMAPQQYPAVRERAMASMIAAREPNVLFIFRQALQSPNPEVQRLGCIGMGALGSQDAIADLEQAMNSTNRPVQLAAALALGAIGTDKAIEVMIHGLFQGTSELRRAIAEALAAIPGEGHNTLREAIVADEIEIRRAAVYGLSRVRHPWALTTLYRTMFEDEQWYVRSAAETAFLVAQSPDREGPHQHPEAETLAWLVEWAGERGQVVPAGDAARQILVRVLQEGQPHYKVLAAQTLGRLGHVAAMKPLYAALRDRDEQVRGAAYAALSDLQTRLGKPLPGLV